MTVNQRERKDPLVEMAELAEELCNPHQHLERIHDWTPGRKRKLTRVYATVQPGLIAQLREAVSTAMVLDEQGRRTVPASKPPLLLEALNRHLTIATSTNRWIWDLQLVNRDTVEANIHGLVGAAPTLDPPLRFELLADLHRWRTWAAVLTGWAIPPLQPHVACPNPDCATMSSLRIDPERKTGFCATCGHMWDDRDGSINLLAAYIKRETEKPPRKVRVGSTVAGHGAWQTRAGGTA